MPPSVLALVVTYNRSALLRESLTALRQQSRPPDATLVIDNASTDDTAEMLATEFPDVTVSRLPANAGGAGGFVFGLETFLGRAEDSIWLLDDDSIPAPAALEQLVVAQRALTAAGHPPAVLASRVHWRDGEMHPMNVPAPRDGARLGTDCVPIRSASFVSILVSRVAVHRYGLPRAGFFVWNDDLEWTGRILRGERGYLVSDSIVEHRTATAHRVWQTKGERFYYEVRNKLFVLRGSAFSLSEKWWMVRTLQHDARRYLRFNGFKTDAWLTILRGLHHGLVHPVPPPGAPPG